MTMSDIGNIPYRLSVLKSVYPDITAITTKAKRLEDAGSIIRLKSGLYVNSPNVSGKRINEFLVANHLYGPSYVSMQTALRYYGLIPENVVEIISMTTGYAKLFSNKVGNFRYVHCADKYFPIGIASVMEEDVSFMIATPEKALCDMIMFTPNLNLRYLSGIRDYIENDMRMDAADLKNFNIDILRECAEYGKKGNMINQLIRIIEDERNV